MATTASASRIRVEFDEIAQLTPETHRLEPMDAWLLANLPGARGSVLEIGCGTGQLARRLAAAFDHVTALDFSEGMIAEARRRTAPDTAIEYVCADMFEWLARSSTRYDCIVTVATLHHVDLRSALRTMASALKPGGRVLVIDLIDRSGWRYLFVNAVAWVVAFGRMQPWSLRRAYWRHGRNETYLRLPEVRLIAQQELPGARVQGHLLWRYSIAWDKAPQLMATAFPC